MQAVTFSIVSIETIERVFGLALANLLPGAAILLGLSYHSDSMRAWLGVVAGQDATFVGFLFAVGASVGLGLIAGAVRGLLLENRLFGLCQPDAVDQSMRVSREAVYQTLVSHHYLYYQAYGNMAVAVVAFGVSYLVATYRLGDAAWGVLGAVIPTAAVLVWASCEAMGRYKRKRGDLLRSHEPS